MYTLPLYRITLAIALMLATGSVTGAQQTNASNPATKQKPAKPTPKRGSEKPALEGAAVVAAPPVLLGQYAEWGAYSARSGGSKICFAIAKPSSVQTTPPGKPRDIVFFFVASRPAENVRNEVSVRIGYALTAATVKIGPPKFPIYTQSDGAWIKTLAEQARLVETMRKGGDLVLTGTSSGMQSIDRYSLKGLSQALDRTAQECK